MTSRWLLHAAEVREIAPTFSVMSLAGRPSCRLTVSRSSWLGMRSASERASGAGRSPLVTYVLTQVLAVLGFALALRVGCSHHGVPQAVTPG
ncbi:MAG: hypothetical protein ACTMIK_06130 [Galactobacter sp.]